MSTGVELERGFEVEGIVLAGVFGLVAFGFGAVPAGPEGGAVFGVPGVEAGGPTEGVVDAVDAVDADGTDGAGVVGPVWTVVGPVWTVVGTEGTVVGTDGSVGTDTSLSSGVDPLPPPPLPPVPEMDVLLDPPLPELPLAKAGATANDPTIIAATTARNEFENNRAVFMNFPRLGQLARQANVLPGFGFRHQLHGKRK
jgi:hypothetical protein